MCVLVYTDSALHNADADRDEEGSGDEWLAKAKQKVIRVRSQHGPLVCVVAHDDLEKTEAIPISCMTWKSNALKRTNLSASGPMPLHVEMVWTWQNTHASNVV